jgi:hypothetical protein
LLVLVKGGMASKAKVCNTNIVGLVCCALTKPACPHTRVMGGDDSAISRPTVDAGLILGAIKHWLASNRH